MSGRAARAGLTLARPSSSPSRGRKTAAAAAARLVDEGQARLVVDMSKRDHDALRMRAIECGKSIREYVLELLARDGALGAKRR